MYSFLFSREHGDKLKDENAHLRVKIGIPDRYLWILIIIIESINFIFLERVFLFIFPIFDVNLISFQLIVFSRINSKKKKCPIVKNIVK